MRAGRPWKRHLLAGQRDPAVQVLVLGEQLQHGLVGAVDVLRVAGERHPAERPFALAEQRPDVGRHEAGIVEGVGHAGVEGALAQVVAVVEDVSAALLKVEHGLTWRAIAPADVAGIFAGLLAAQSRRPRPASGRRDIGQGVVGGGLVGDDIGHDAAQRPARERLRRHCPSARWSAASPLACASSTRVIASSRCPPPHRRSRFQPALGARRIDLDHQGHALVHRHRQRLRAAHAAQTGGQHQLAAQRCASRAGGPARRASRTCPAGCPGCRCRSTSRPSSGRT